MYGIFWLFLQKNQLIYPMLNERNKSYDIIFWVIYEMKHYFHIWYILHILV